jgi:hypothetical protein
MPSKLIFKIVVIGLFVGIASIFYYLADKHKGDEKEKTYKRIGQFFEYFPWIILIVAFVLAIILIFVG